MTSFPSLDGFEATRATLHRYARAINALSRVHAETRPHWWHTSLKVTADGLIGDPLRLPGGGRAELLMDLTTHAIVLIVDASSAMRFPMTAGWSGTDMGAALIGAIAGLGLSGEYERQRFESSAFGDYDVDAAQRFFSALVTADRVFKRHIASLSGNVSPVQLWPHNFDLSCEWFGTKLVATEENGATTHVPAQLNLGFYPGGNNMEAYFYSNPWPFDEAQLLGHELPEGAKWHQEGWQGTMLPYGALMGQPDAEERLAKYARTVFGIAFPTLID